MQNQQNALSQVINLNEYPPDKYNVLAPITIMQTTSNLQKLEMKKVTLDTRLDKDSRVIGSDIYFDRTAKKYAITKVAGTKLASAAGITIVSSESVTPDVCKKCVDMAKATGKAQVCGSCPHQYDVKYKVTVSVPAPSGEIRYVTKEKELDCALEKESMKPEQYKRFLPFRAAHAESKAFMRCLRDALGLSAGYTLEQLRKPFVIVRMIPNLDAPELREAVASNYLNSMGLLFGAAPKPPALTTAETTPRPEPPQLPEANPNDYSEGDFADYTTDDDHYNGDEDLPWNVNNNELELDGIFCEDCGIEIEETQARNGQIWSPDAIKGYSEKTFGACICPDCQQGRKESRS